MFLIQPLAATHNKHISPCDEFNDYHPSKSL